MLILNQKMLPLIKTYTFIIAMSNSLKRQETFDTLIDTVLVTPRNMK